MIGCRVSAEIKNRLDEAAQKSGRSQAQELELRLQQSFEMEDMMQFMRERDAAHMHAFVEAIKGFAEKTGATPAQIAATETQMDVFLKTGIMFPHERREEEDGAA
jgi:Mn-containing catalase